MVISGLFLADKMDVSAETQTSTETIDATDTTYDKVYDVSAWVADGIETVKFEIAVSEVTGESATVQFKVDGDTSYEAALNEPASADTDIEWTYNVDANTETVEVLAEGIKGTLTITCTQEIEDEGEPTPSDTDSSEPTTAAVRKTVSQPEQYEQTVYAAADTIKTMNLDTSYLAPSDGTWDASNDHKVYFGQYNNNSTAFRVLKVENETMMLDCDTILLEKTFDGSSNNWQNSSNNWSNSSLRSWLNGGDYYGSESVFTTAEKNAIAETILLGTPESYNTYYKDYDDTAHIYLLSAKEANDLYADNDARVKKNSSNDASWWWLRTACAFHNDDAGHVVSNGEIYNNSAAYNNGGVCPALNIKLSSVLFASANGVSKSSAGGSLTQVITDTTTKQWKLTLLDTSKEVKVTEGESVTQDGSIITVPYTYTGSGVSQISVMITSGDYTESGTEILYYGKLDTNLSTSGGTGTFTLPDRLPNRYKIYILAEDVNEEKITDYASEPITVAEQTDTNEEGSDSSETTPSAVRKTSSQQKQASQPEQYEHTHEYEWVTVREATEDRDAEEVYRCRYCGDVKYRMEVPNSAYAQFNQNAITTIDRAASGAAVKFKTNLWVSFPKEVLEALKERPDVSVTIDYLYHGVWYTVTIPAGADLDALEDSEGYYGFRYLDQVFGGSLCRVSQ